MSATENNEIREGDDVQGHGTNLPVAPVEQDDDTEGHGLSIGRVQPLPEDMDVEGHGRIAGNAPVDDDTDDASGHMFWSDRDLKENIEPVVQGDGVRSAGERAAED